MKTNEYLGNQMNWWVTPIQRDWGALGNTNLLDDELQEDKLTLKIKVILYSILGWIRDYQMTCMF